MTIFTKTNGQPKNEGVKPIPRRTVERKGANMRKKFLLLVRIFILFLLLFIFYFTFPLIGIDFHLFLSKCLLAKSLHLLFSRLGCLSSSTARAKAFPREATPRAAITKRPKGRELTLITK
ncbi:hypothetical protein Salmi_Mp087 (mitochondrion) [Salvia miltiorrhiza]|uniref:Uncharacterized protein n=1 Tax=Salvia miltiorrhiza TaxID=226208 RepID=V9P4S5_SALMI|nr:hypothetical protein Salmi_Mp087 [Salvia miltiorrhiza]AGU16615.1 hypothetical protein Salmi_Mp087 [Salvia miltiorrhiza]